MLQGREVTGSDTEFSDWMDIELLSPVPDQIIDIEHSEAVFACFT